jgi:hypothetical protein
MHGTAASEIDDICRDTILQIARWIPLKNSFAPEIGEKQLPFSTPGKCGRLEATHGEEIPTSLDFSPVFCVVKTVT